MSRYGSARYNRSGSIKRRPAPSVKSIMSVLGPNLVNEYGGESTGARAKAAEIRHIMQVERNHDGLQMINKILRGHGVEFVAQNPHEFLPGRMGEHFEYVNMGDTYAPTVILYRGKWRLGDYGSLIESLERRGKRFQ